MTEKESIERQRMDVDIACVGFGPAMGGFLTTLSKNLSDPGLQSKIMPGMPLQVVCYERADDLGFGVSGVCTKAKSLRESFPDLNPKDIPMACDVKNEEVLYLMDPIGASRRSPLLKIADFFAKVLKLTPLYKDHAIKLPFIPPFLRKDHGILLSIGQFNQWVGTQLMGSGQVQLWPSMPVKEPHYDKNAVAGIRLVDQGMDKSGKPSAGFTPGMDIHARLTVVADGPTGPVGLKLNEKLGLPKDNHQRDWAVGMKFVVELPEDTTLKEGSVIHTFGYPEPEIFGFLYVLPNRMASLGIFVPSWFSNPARTAYRYLQHWMMHPYLWKHLKGATLRSWGAKTLQESGKRGEPILAGDGFARIGEGSGSTNILTGSGVDEAWETGRQLGQSVLELLKSDKDFSEENLSNTYIKKRRSGWLEKEARIAKKSRDGFHHGFIPGLLGMALSGMTGGLINMPGKPKEPHKKIQSLGEFFKGKISAQELDRIQRECESRNESLHNAIMDRLGWPKIPFDNKLLMSHQDALLVGGKVQAQEGYADHVTFVNKDLCKTCKEKVCIEGCSGQAIMPGDNGGVPQFDREKCVHCGACLWNCSKARETGSELGNIDFSAGSGGLHSAEN